MVHAYTRAYYSRSHGRMEMSLEQYRQMVIHEFYETLPSLSESLKADVPEFEFTDLVGSVLDKKRFKEYSDVDVAVYLKEDTPPWRAAEIYDQLNGTIHVGGSTADVLIYVGHEFACFDETPEGVVYCERIGDEGQEHEEMEEEED
jgi:hypothetical protein